MLFIGLSDQKRFMESVRLDKEERLAGWKGGLFD